MSQGRISRAALAVGQITPSSRSSSKFLSRANRKFFAFPVGQIIFINSLRPVPLEGRLAIVTNAGRDAVDAGGAFDEWRRKRTAKSCGPDAPTLASSSR
jgi:hypothetical protein